MRYVVEKIHIEPVGQSGDQIFARSIIGEAYSTIAACEMIAAECGEDVSAVLLRRSDAELSEGALRAMVAALSAIDRNAIAVPRLSSIDDPVRWTQVPFNARVSIPDGACALLKMGVYRRFGPLENVPGGIEGAIIAYGNAVNDAGYTTIVAANAVAFLPTGPKVEDTSFDAIDKHRYLGPFLEFASSASLRKPRVLFDFHDMPPFYCGTSEYQMALIRYFKDCFAAEYDVTVRCNEEALGFHGIRAYGFDVLLPEEEAGLFDIGLVATQPVNLEKQFFLNEHCLKIVYTMLDCIWLRSHYLCMEGPEVEDVARCGLRNCDGIIAISDFSRRDYLDYFSSDQVIQAKASQVVYISTDFGNGALADIREEVPFKRYDLVIGNSFKHKALDRALAAISGTEIDYVFVGLPEGIQLPENVVAFPNAQLEESFLDALYAHCDSVVFPSQYEGFGLPITIAFRHGKRVIVCDNELNREIEEHFPQMRENMLFFSSFEEIPLLSARARKKGTFSGSLTDSWQGAIVEVEAFLKRILDRPIDWFAIDQRQWEYRLIQEEMQIAEERIGFKRLIWRRLIKGHRMRERLYRRLTRSEIGVEN